MKQPAIYILASKPNGVLYVGVTSDLIKRIWQHKQNSVKGFSDKYNVHDLVYYEQYDSMVDAIFREKQIKRWQRSWKIRLIEKDNLKWEDLYASIV